MPKTFEQYKALDPRFVAVMDELGKTMPAADPSFGQVWRAIVEVESNGDATAVGDGGTSYGYLQLHQDGGQGTGYTASQLLNPATNAQIGGPPIAQAYARGVTDGKTGMDLLNFVAINSGHPISDGNAAIPGVSGYLRILDITAGYLNPDGTPVAGAAAGPAADVPASAPQAAALDLLHSLGVIRGTGGGSDNPGALVSRAEMELALARLYEAILAKK